MERKSRGVGGRAVVAAAAAAVLAVTAGAQFRTTVPLVLAPTTVTDASGKIVETLEPGSLVLYDNGKPQAVQVDEYFSPISLVVAIQTSSNSAAILDKLGSSGILFSNLVAGEEGETALVTFADEVRTLRDFTSDSDVLAAGLRSLHVQGNGAVMLDAVTRSLAMLGKRAGGRRRVLLVIGEKHDRSSKVPFEAVMREAERQNVLIYWLHYSTFLEPFTAKPKQEKSTEPGKEGAPLPPETAPGNLLSVFTQLAQQDKADASAQLPRVTGGRSIGFVEQEALEEAIQAIGAEIHSQYIVSFTPRPVKTLEYHAIRVEVKDHPEWTARTRAGYWTLK